MSKEFKKMPIEWPVKLNLVKEPEGIFIECLMKIPFNSLIGYGLRNASAKILAFRQKFCRICGDNIAFQPTRIRDSQKPYLLCLKHLRKYKGNLKRKYKMQERPHAIYTPRPQQEKSTIWAEIQKQNNLTLPAVNVKSRTV